MRLALIGDVGGHSAQLVDLLERLGVDLDAPAVPEDLTIVQVGDLIDRGPDSPGCVALADRLMTHFPDQWVQLLGNHEGNRVGGPVFWDEPLDDVAEATLLDWWDEGRARMAVAVQSEELGDLLICHGGLTGTVWHVVGKPELSEAVTLLNSWVGERPDLAFAAGALLGLQGAFVGPAWADALTELYPSWDRAPSVPFGQVHGHSAICDWRSGRLHPRASGAVRQGARIDAAHRRTRVDIGGRPFLGIDPTLGTDATGVSLSALVLRGKILA